MEWLPCKFTANLLENIAGKPRYMIQDTLCKDVSLIFHRATSHHLSIDTTRPCFGNAQNITLFRQNTFRATWS